MAWNPLQPSKKLPSSLYNHKTHRLLREHSRLTLSDLVSTLGQSVAPLPTKKLAVALLAILVELDRGLCERGVSA
jgi:hypothetical protein